ncbi:MAG: hypothetical protein KAR35_03835 [Candidatus Heimdallarchaeota archaeon]|nr:hypothetical protein [Candidatus Heimdallarchaeota archaeon]MCK5048485.1 hypothetical protein [Candidatus Heimdallarchaeota archaeon]
MINNKIITFHSVVIILILSLGSYSSVAGNTWYFEIDDQISFKKTENFSINTNSNNTLSQFKDSFLNNCSFLPIYLKEEVSDLEKSDYFYYNISSIPQDSDPIRGNLLINDQQVSDNVSSFLIIPSSLIDYDYDSVATISLYFSSFFEKFNWTHNLEVYSKEYHFSSGDIWVIETILNFQSFDEGGSIWQGFFKWEYAYSGEAYWLNTKVWQVTSSENNTFANSDPEYDNSKMNAFYHFSFTSQTALDLIDDFKKIQTIVWTIVIGLFIGIPIIILIYQTIKK